MSQRGGRNNNNQRNDNNNQRQGGGGQRNNNNNNNQRQGDRPNNAPNANFRARNRLPGMVRAVPSGDTVVLVNLQDQTTNGPPKEITLTMSGIKSPVLGRKLKDKTIEEESFAWQSREYLRKLLIGKSVVYYIEHEVPNRAYGEVWLEEKSVRNMIVEEGWAEVTPKKEKPEKEGQQQNRKGDLRPRKEDIEHEQLVKVMEEAKAKQKGIFNPNKNVRKVKYIEHVRDANPAELEGYFEKNKGKPLQAVVEQVRTGTTFRVYVPSTQEEFVVSLSGAHSPVYRFGDEANSEPFSREAKFFSEHCLLHRDVTVVLETMDKFSNYFGTILDSQKRNIGFNLISTGLASFIEWNAPTDVAEKWKEAENKAISEKLRIWKKPKNSEPVKLPPLNNSNMKVSLKEFLGQVIEVVNAGTIIVRVTQKDEYTDIGVSFSSIQPLRNIPKTENSNIVEDDQDLNNNKKRRDRPDKVEDTYANLAKEHLRKSLIGKKVKCVLDYTQPGTKSGNTTYPPRPRFSVYNGKNCVATDLLKRGLAELIYHPADDQNRASEYSSMVLAEKSAKHDGVGIHAPKSKAPIVHINDLTSLPDAKCRPFLQTLKRIGTLPAIVELPFSTTRFKVFIPSQSLVIAFGISACTTLKTERDNDYQPEEGQVVDYRKRYPLIVNGENHIGNLGYHYSRTHLLQREVEITIDDIVNGTFLGKLVVNKSDYLTELVKTGLVELRLNIVEKMNNKVSLLAALEDAQKAKRGIWKDYDPVAEEARKNEFKQKRKEEREQDQTFKQRNRSIIITEVMSGSTFFYQLADEESKTHVEDLMADFTSRDWNSKPHHTPENKEWIAAKFTADNSWYRAQVLRVNKREEGNTYEVRYVDYGNTEVLTSKNIRKLDADFLPEKHPAKAFRGKLAYIRAPTLKEEFGEDAAAMFKELVWGNTLISNEQFEEGIGSDAISHMLLGIGEVRSQVNITLVKEGMARVEARNQTNITNMEVYTLLKNEQDKAKAKRICIWQYGDVPDSDEERQWAKMLK